MNYRTYIRADYTRGQYSDDQHVRARKERARQAKLKRQAAMMVNFTEEEFNALAR